MPVVCWDWTCKLFFIVMFRKVKSRKTKVRNTNDSLQLQKTKTVCRTSGAPFTMCKQFCCPSNPFSAVLSPFYFVPFDHLQILHQVLNVLVLQSRTIRRRSTARPRSFGASPTSSGRQFSSGMKTFAIPIHCCSNLMGGKHFLSY